MTNWDHLRYYLEVARGGSVTAASQRLRVSHATVLRHIDQLEQDLGTKLLKRLQSCYQLSDEGEKLLDKALLMKSAMQDVEQTIHKKSNEMSGVLRVTQTDSDCLNLYDLYAQFSACYPSITLEIDTSCSLRNLNRQEFDVAIRFADNPHELLVGRNLGTVEYGPYATRGYLQRFGDTPIIDELGWIIQGKSVNNWAGKADESSFGKLYRLIDRPRIVFQSDDYTAIESALLAGVGVGAGFVSHLRASKHGDLVPIPTHDLTSYNNAWILTHRDLRDTVKVRCFMDFIADRLRGSLHAIGTTALSPQTVVR